jgi:peptide/nickel transport system ATP-binding protein
MGTEVHAHRASNGDSPVLEVHGLCASYGEGAGEVRAVIDVDLVLRRGEVLGIAGESGSGKSTLAYAMTRLLRSPGVITGGEAIFHPEGGAPIDLLSSDTDELHRVRWNELAIVFQSAMNSLNPVLTIEDQLTDVLATHRPHSTRAERHERAAHVLEMVGIDKGRLKSYSHELSGGMRQRVMIAMALVLEPQLVIMDEPTTALDVVTQRQILREVMDLRDRLGFSVIFITHDLSLLIEIADTIAVMYAGRLVEQAPAEALFHRPRHPYTQGLLASFPSLHGERKKLMGIPGSPADPRNAPSGCAFRTRCQYAMDKCAARVPILAPPQSALDVVDRDVACFLHDGEQSPPAALAKLDGGSSTAPDPVPGTSAGPPEPAGPAGPALPHAVGVVINSQGRETNRGDAVQ